MVSQVFDPEDTGEIDVERLQQMLAEDGDTGSGLHDKELEGEPFGRMIAALWCLWKAVHWASDMLFGFHAAFMTLAREPGKGTIAYEDYVAKLMASIELTPSQ